jgi:hypothetical protein
MTPDRVFSGLSTLENPMVPWSVFLNHKQEKATNPTSSRSAEVRRSTKGRNTAGKEADGREHAVDDAEYPVGDEQDREMGRRQDGNAILLPMGAIAQVQTCSGQSRPTDTVLTTRLQTQ